MNNQVTIPIQVLTIPPKGYHIFVDGKIGRKRINFLIDTGASKSVIDQEFAKQFFPDEQVTKTDHLTTGLGANIPNSSFIRLNRIRIGKHKITSTKFALLDLSIVNDAYASAGLEPVLAIIGGDILKKYGAVIDYANRILLLHT
ncbi:MAG: retropepsin-like aspartic protease [Chitinophagales bacterium]